MRNNNFKRVLLKNIPRSKIVEKLLEILEKSELDTDNRYRAIHYLSFLGIDVKTIISGNIIDTLCKEEK